MIMKIYSDIENENCKSRIISSLERLGYSAEHNFYHFLCKKNSKNENYFFEFENGKGIMATFRPDIKTWSMVSEVLAPKNERVEIFSEFLDYIFKNDAKKIFVEFEDEFKEEAAANLSKKYKISATNYKLYWPVYNLASFDESLNGKDWKKIRNISNKFNKNFRVEVKNIGGTDENSLTAIFNLWLEKRTHNDFVDREYYKNIIKRKFEGFDKAKLFLIDGDACIISAGWKIPNSKSFYWSVGMHNYKYDGLSEFANLIDLADAKSSGYKYAELGGSDRSLLLSKEKFKPERVYTTNTFSVMKKLTYAVKRSC